MIDYLKAIQINQSFPDINLEQSRWFTTEKDPILDTWPLMSSPIPIVTILSIYFVFVSWLGPQLMNDRKPFDLRNWVVLYNTTQVIFSIWICFIQPGFRIDYTYYFVTDGCYPVHKSQYLIDMHAAGWWYVIAKLTELIDTVFFVLRKKNNQITKLHLYHHTSTALFAWMYLKYLPGEQGTVTGFLNTFVHIFMYTYYAITAMGTKYQKYLWWKNYITLLQIIQFLLNIIYFSALLWMNCQAPKAISILFAINSIIFMILFTKFYKHSYKKSMQKID